MTFFGNLLYTMVGNIGYPCEDHTTEESRLRGCNSTIATTQVGVLKDAPTRASTRNPKAKNTRGAEDPSDSVKSTVY